MVDKSTNCGCGYCGDPGEMSPELRMAGHDGPRAGLERGSGAALVELRQAGSECELRFGERGTERHIQCLAELQLRVRDSTARWQSRAPGTAPGQVATPPRPRTSVVFAQRRTLQRLQRLLSALRSFREPMLAQLRVGNEQARGDRVERQRKPRCMPRRHDVAKQFERRWRNRRARSRGARAPAGNDCSWPGRRRSRCGARCPPLRRAACPPRRSGPAPCRATPARAAPTRAVTSPDSAGVRRRHPRR